MQTCGFDKKQNCECIESSCSCQCLTHDIMGEHSRILKSMVEIPLGNTNMFMEVVEAFWEISIF